MHIGIKVNLLIEHGKHSFVQLNGLVDLQLLHLGSGQLVTPYLFLFEVFVYI